MLAYEVWVLQVREKLLCGSSVRNGFENRERKVYRNQVSAHRVVELLPCRLRRPGSIGEAYPAETRTRGRKRAARQNRQKGHCANCFQECSSRHLALSDLLSWMSSSAMLLRWMIRGQAGLRLTSLTNTLTPPRLFRR